MGCTKTNMLTFVDADQNKPLNAAVQFGNINAVKLCLDNGASIDEISDIHNNTPVHIASAQGNLDMLRLMKEKQPCLFNELIHAENAIEMTPLHKAAMFDHVDVAGFLLENGSNLDPIDSEKRSPMLLAASRNCINVVSYLLRQGANINLKDFKNRNLLHLTISQEMYSFLESSESSSVYFQEKVINELLKVKA